MRLARWKSQGALPEAAWRLFVSTLITEAPCLLVCRGETQSDVGRAASRNNEMESCYAAELFAVAAHDRI